jgi:hypothetical protein
METSLNYIKGVYTGKLIGNKLKWKLGVVTGRLPGFPDMKARAGP